LSRTAVVLDANLLVLLIVGLTDVNAIRHHKRLGKYSPAAYQLLAERLNRASEIIVTPNILTETSNLLSRGPEPLRTMIMSTLRSLVAGAGAGTVDRVASEQFVPSQKAAARTEFLRLGLSDTATLEIAQGSAVLLTDDLDLYLAALNSGRQAENFTYLRDAADVL
jgi:hypothetical protein